MSSLRSAVSGAVGRLRPRPQERRDGYAFCPEDRYWFRPAYTEGECPLCGMVAPGGIPEPSLWQRMDRSWFGVAGLALESIGMLVLVLLMYYRG